MSIFDLTEQNKNIDYKIVAGLERLSNVFKTLLWKHAKELNLSPVQIQILIFINYHQEEENNISYLATEFNITKATVSDAVKVLEQKRLVLKKGNVTDNRRFSLTLTKEGKRIVLQTENYTAPFEGWVSEMKVDDKEVMWKSLSNLIYLLHQSGAIEVQKICYTCTHFCRKNNMPFCSLLNQKLQSKDIRMDCPEYVGIN